MGEMKPELILVAATVAGAAYLGWDRYQEWKRAKAHEELWHSITAPRGFFIDTTPEEEPCKRLTKCRWDQAIAESYERCGKYTKGQVGMVCNGATGAWQVVGGGVHVVYKKISGWF